MAAPAKSMKIGKYEILETIGRGGMGVVYKGRDPFLDSIVAIKVMNVDIHENADFLERFRREARATAVLRDHPNIVNVYEFGEHQGRPFMVMQYLEGQSLETVLRSQRQLSLLDRLNIVIEICQGLSYAHKRRIIHRDIKPANIFVLNDGAVKLLDFGIARLGDNTVTHTGQIVGSLYYMSPEQIKSSTVDERADIYATGVVLYQLLTYSLPFEADSTVATLAKIISDDPPPFSQFGVNCPPELEAITLKALSKNREQRYSSAENLAAALVEVQTKLKQDVISGYLSKAELLQESGELVQAQEWLEKVLRLDRQNTTAMRLRSAIQASIQAQVAAERSRQLQERAEQAFQRGELDQALASIGQALEINRNDAGLQSLKQRIEKSKSNAELVRRAVARAEAAQRAGDLDAAKSAIDNAFEQRPDDSHIKALRRAIERDLEERTRHKQVEDLLDQARRQMSAKKYTDALNFLKEAQQLDASAPQLRLLLERLASEHKQEKHRKELERLHREVQEALDSDNYKAASAKAAEALQKFPSEANLLRLKELADTQIAVAEEREFVRAQIASAEQALDLGQTQKALALVESGLQQVPGNSRLESLRTMLRERLAKDLAEADKASCLQQANEALSLRRYDDAVRILESARLRFPDSSDIDELLRFVRDQQTKQERQAFADKAVRDARQAIEEQDFDSAIRLLEAALERVPSEELKTLLRQARGQSEAFQTELKAVVAKGRALLEEGAILQARDFLRARPPAYQRHREFREVLAEAQAASVPSPPASDNAAPTAVGATQLFRGSPSGSDTVVDLPPAPPDLVYSQVSGTPPPRGRSDSAGEPPSPSRRHLLLAAGAALFVIVIGLVVYRMWPTPQKQAYLAVNTKPEAQIVVDGISYKANEKGSATIPVTPGNHEIGAVLKGYQPYSGNVMGRAGEKTPVELPLEPEPPSRAVEQGTLVVNSLPGAEVFINGSARNVVAANGKATIPLDPAHYTVQTKKSGYKDADEQPVEIAAHRSSSLTFKLQEIISKTFLKISSSPAGAAVRVDGRSAGVTGQRPLLTKVEPGDRYVEFSLEGYEASKQKIVAIDGQTVPVSVSLTPLPVPPAEILEFEPAQGKTIQEGQRITLTWKTQHAEKVQLNGMDVSRDGRHDDDPLKSRDYTLTAISKGGAATPKTIRINVEPRPVESAQIVMFGPENQSIPKGQQATLRWKVANASEVFIDHGIGRVVEENELKLPLNETTTFTLTAKGKDGKSILQKSLTIAIKEKEERQPPSGGDVTGVNEALQQWRAAYSAKAISDMISLFPNMPKDYKDYLGRQFKMKEGISLEIRCNPANQPTFTSSETADWACTETSFITEGGKRIKQGQAEVHYKFKLKENGWIITGR